jgi:DNA adenine methylase
MSAESESAPADEYPASRKEQSQTSRRTTQQLVLFGDPEHPFQIRSHRRIHRIRPPVKAHGGKYYLAPKIAPILLSAPGRVTEYLEPCAYGASVFLALPRFEREILGDINPEVADLWTALADERHSDELQERINRTRYTEATFQSAKADDAPTVLARAFRAIIKCRFSRGGLGKDFAWSERLRGGRPGDENAWETFRERELPRIIERARGIEVTSDPCWWTVWESRHRIQRLIYADPPYMRETRTAKRAYGPHEMTRLHHFWLVAALRTHSGPAAISGYRCPAYDRWLDDWRRFDFDMPNNSGQGRRKQRRTESLWVNW